MDRERRAGPETGAVAGCRRGISALAAAMLVASSVIGGGGGPAQADTEGSNGAGTVVTVGMLPLGASLNPFDPASSSASFWPIADAVMPAALQWRGTPTGEPEPGIAVEVPTVDNGGVVVNPDGTATIRYELDAEAVWEDGTPISGADLAFTHDVICASNDAFNLSRWQLCPDGPSDAHVVPGSVTAEPKAVEVTLSQPTLEYIRLFSVILPSHKLEGTDIEDDWHDEMWLSGGPFRFVEWVEGERLVLERNPNYWRRDPVTGADLPRVERLEFRFYDDQQALLPAFATQEVDVAPSILPLPSTFEDLIALRQIGADVQFGLQGSLLVPLYFQFGPGRFERNERSLNEHLKYRRAVAHAVDREAIADQLFAGEGPGGQSILAPTAPHLSEHPWSQYDHNPEAARGLLSSLEDDLDADFDEHIPLLDVILIEAEARRIVAMEILEDMLASGNMEYRAEILDALQWVSLVFPSEDRLDSPWDTTMFGWSTGGGTAGAASFLQVFEPGASSQVGGWGLDGADVGGEPAERYGEIMDELRTTIDLAAAVPLIQEAEAILADQMVVLPLFSQPQVGGAWSDHVRGFQTTAGLALYQVDRWWVPRIVTGNVDEGGTLTTDPAGEGATEEEPIQVAVTSPTAGEVTIELGPLAEPDPEGFELLDVQLELDAPEASTDDPLSIVFSIHPSQLPEGEDGSTLQVFRDGVMVQDCAGQHGNADPDPCVAERELLDDDQVRLTVLSSTASTWHLGSPLTEPTQPETHISIDGPTEATVDEPTNFEVRLTNTEADIPENVRVEFAVVRDNNIEEDDLTLEWCAVPEDDGCDDWQALELTAEDGALIGDFGPVGGFTVHDNYDETTLIRATFTTADAFHTTAVVRGTNTREAYATTDHTVMTADPPSEEVCLDLLAAQDLLVGEVCLSLDDSQLVAVYTTRDGWTLDQTHLAASTDEPGTGEWVDGDEPWLNPRGMPSPGRFPHWQAHDPLEDGTATYVIAMSALENTNDSILFLAAHADVAHLADGRNEGAWAHGTRFVDRGTWATWFSITIPTTEARGNAGPATGDE